MKSTLRSAIAFLTLLLSLASLPGLSRAQAAPYERTYATPISDVERVVRNLRPTSTGRLPTVDGFVEANDQPIERYERGYYECTFQVVATPTGGATVRAIAKITAWYNDPTPARSGYRVMVSNGHIENDFLDQIQEALGPAPGTKPTNSQTAGSPAKTSAASAESATSGASRPPAKLDPSALGLVESSSNKSPTARTYSNLPGQPAEPAAPLMSKTESLESLKLQRAAVDKRAQELSADIKNFEDILHNQARPADLAVVKKAGTRVFSKPSDTSGLLFSAEAEDEFQVLELEGAWVHVQISGASRGWIRRVQLDLPPEFANQAGQSADPPPDAASLFNLNRDETSAFGGKWEPLKGKQVKVIWLEPASPTATTTANQKLSFAIPLFEETYKQLKSSAAPVEGVVLVFDSADGGQIAATIASIKGLVDGSIAPPEFLRQCSLDPPESFQDSAKK